MISEIPLFDGIGRGEKAAKRAYIKSLYPAPNEIESFSMHIAKRITGIHNKDFKFLLVGEQGSGKSVSLLYLAQRIADSVVELKGGVREDYFCFENVAIIDADDLEDKMNNLKRWNIYILDDAGVSWDARDFATSTNKRLNHIFQVCRTANAAILVSVPDTFLIDKVGRTLVSYYGEVSESLHDFGKNLIKIFRVKRLFREGKTLHYNMTYGNNKVVRHESGTPDKQMLLEYEKARKYNATRVNVNKKEEKKQALKDITSQEKENDMMAIHTAIQSGESITNSIAQVNRITGKKYSRFVFNSWKIESGMG